MPSTLNTYEQIYALSAASNGVGGLNGTQAKLQQALQAALATTLGPGSALSSWTIQWGPRVWKASPDDSNTGPENVWFAAVCPQLAFSDGNFDTCVVAIAGTATSGECLNYEWKNEDFGVNQIQNFTEWVKSWTAKSSSKPVPTSPCQMTASALYCSIGTETGVYNILNNSASSGYPGSDTTVVLFLQSLPSNYRIIFTGHSLGGALSPTLALGLSLAKYRLLPNDPDILTFPTAGASPGNSNFAEAYNEAFKPRFDEGGYQVFNDDLFNTYDIVPQAWGTDISASPDRNLHNIQSIYGKFPVVFGAEVDFAVYWGVERSDSSKINYIPIQGRKFTGPSPTSVPQNKTQLITEAIKQHTRAYYDYIDPSGMITDIHRSIYAYVSKQDGISKQTVDQVAAAFPVLRKLKSDERVGHPNGGQLHPYDEVFGSNECTVLPSKAKV